MAIYMISYDLTRPGQDYKDVRDTIESLGAWCHYLESNYLVKTSLSITDVNDKITKYLDGSDRLLVCEIVKPISGWLTKKQWDWINSNL